MLSLFDLSDLSAGDIPTSHNYVQIVDCSVALYEKLQQHTQCADPSKPDSGPFCTSYHLGYATQDEQKQAAPKQVRSSLYYFLPNTMVEFPFAWWHKCILLQVLPSCLICRLACDACLAFYVVLSTLPIFDAGPSSSGPLFFLLLIASRLNQGRTLSTKEEAVHCAQWRENAIPADEMEGMQGIFDEREVRSVLLRINGGVTSGVVRRAVEELEGSLRLALSSFALSGKRSEPELTSFRSEISSSRVLMGSIDGSMLRIGAPSDFNMKCYSATSLPADAAAFVDMGSSKGINCPHNMLMWMRNEGADFTRSVERVV